MLGLVRGVARTAAVVGTATAVSGRVQRRQQGRWAAQDAQQAPPQQPEAYYAPPPPPAPAPEQPDMLAQLTQLGELRSSGVLTEAEFEVQKAKILAS